MSVNGGGDSAADDLDDFVGSSDSSGISSDDEPVIARHVAAVDVPVAARNADEHDDDDDDVQITEVRPPTVRQPPGRQFLLPTLRPQHRRANPTPPSSDVSNTIVLDDGDDSPGSSAPPPVKRQRADGKVIPPIPPAPAADVGRIQQDSINAAKIHMRCPLCLDTMVTITSTKCGHVYCRACIAQAILDLQRCPLCSRRLSLRDIHPVFL